LIFFRVINVLKPGSVAKIKRPFTKDACSENLENAISAIKSFGIPDDKMFTAEDITEGQGIPNVINCFLAIGRKVNRVSFEYTFLTQSYM
jgi:muscle protein 20-like protein